MNIGAKQKTCLLVEGNEQGLEMGGGSSLTDSPQKPGRFISLPRTNRMRAMW